MTASGGGGGSRRPSASRVPLHLAPEPNENDALAASPSPPEVTPPFSLRSRSPLVAIADPGRSLRSVPGTPKTLAGIPKACAAVSGICDRSGSQPGQSLVAAAAVPSCRHHSAGSVRPCHVPVADGGGGGSARSGLRSRSLAPPATRRWRNLLPCQVMIREISRTTPEPSGPPFWSPPTLVRRARDHLFKEVVGRSVHPFLSTTRPSLSRGRRRVTPRYVLIFHEAVLQVFIISGR
ncbi:hypothetical protein ZWY2020_012812 [Hordeum vulgare]|nr:hypothetical protein ZWY2020_012812 [Hordeum vulgare]